MESEMEREAFEKCWATRYPNTDGEEWRVIKAVAQVMWDACATLNAPAPAAGDWVLVAQAMRDDLRKYKTVIKHADGILLYDVINGDIDRLARVAATSLSAAPIAPPVQAVTEEEREAIEWLRALVGDYKGGRSMASGILAIIDRLTAQPKEPA